MSSPNFSRQIKQKHCAPLRGRSAFCVGRMGAGALFGGAPVVHFGEWSTGFLEKGRNQAKAPKRREPVVHFGEWSTSFPEKGRN